MLGEDCQEDAEDGPEEEDGHHTAQDVADVPPPLHCVDALLTLKHKRLSLGATAYESDWFDIQLQDHANLETS